MMARAPGPARFQKDRAENRLNRIGENRAALSALGVLFTAAENKMSAEAQAEGEGLEMMAVDQLRAV